jgi:hypothetical protein
MLLGGEITGNLILNARQGINVDGAGTADAPLNLHDNPVLGWQAMPLWDCQQHATSAINIAPEPHAHLVNRVQGSTPITSQLWDHCVP